MPQDIRLWQITDGDVLKEINQTKLNLEDRIEGWLESDISIISDELIVIGRQIETDFGGIIDLLCLAYNGDLVIIELKRDKTPREITAQILDYASWVKDLTSDKIMDLANNYLGDKGTIEDIYYRKFGYDFPEILNESHKMLVVASEIDSSSERIIKYLSDSYGVPLNAMTFHYFQTEEKSEFLARVYLLEPSEVDYKQKKKSPTKRAQPLSLEEFQDIANNNGIGDIFKKVVENFTQLFDQTTYHKTGIAFKGVLGEGRSYNSIIVLYPPFSEAEKGLLANVYIDRLAVYLNDEKPTIMSMFPTFDNIQYREWAEGENGNVYLKNEEEIDRLLMSLRDRK